MQQQIQPAAMASDSVSSVADMKVKNKQFIKTADVNMEVKDVYNATIAIEKSVQELGGFVTNSNLQSNVFQKTLIILPMKKLCLSKNTRLKIQCRYGYLLKN
jgi:hypothetical protein